MGALWHLALTLAVVGLPAQPSTDPHEVLQEAERLAWLRAWTRAAPLYEEAERLFAARGDRRNALYAEINRLRGDLPRLPVPEVSERLAEYLEDPLVESDEQLRLRCLVIKGETDTDLDPSLAEESWREARDLATKLGEAGWANRAEGELGILAFLQGDVSASVIGLGTALKNAEATGDVASQVRWLTVFGHGFVQVGRVEQALSFYDRALDVASGVPELQFPVMTYLGKGEALSRLGQSVEAEDLLNRALAIAEPVGALGYRAELLLKLGLIQYEHGEIDRALASLGQAMELAEEVGADRVRANVAVDLARIQQAAGRSNASEATLRDGIAAARRVADRLLLPRLLAQLADLESARERHTSAADLLDEASDLLEGMLANTSSPWVRSRLVAVMDEVFEARIRVEGARGPDPQRLFAVLEQARARSLLDLLRSRPLADLPTPPALKAGQRAISALQVKLYQTESASERRRIVDEIFDTEQGLAAVSTELFDRARTTDPRKPVTLKAVQAALRPDELLVEFALAEPRSYCIVITGGTVRVQELPGQTALGERVEPLLDKVRAGEDASLEAKDVGAVLLAPLEELATRSRVIVSPDGPLHGLPFEVLIGDSHTRLIDTHVVSYVPSASILALIRDRHPRVDPPRLALAVSAWPGDDRAVLVDAGSVERGIYELDLSELRPLPSADDEARSVVEILGPAASTVLLGESATEVELKRQPLHEYRVVHFAVHGMLSTEFPERSALVVRPAGDEDGLLQAREILALRLDADLVAMSACDTGRGPVYGHDGVASLIRPFLGAGARSVVANLWAVDDRFSLALMREFYRQLVGRADVADALRRAKLRMIELFGPRATLRLWSGVLAYGDATATIPVAETSGQ